MSLNTGNAILSNGITLDSSYNVGIGTSTPLGKLHVSSPTAVDAYIVSSGGDYDTNLYLGYASAYTQTYIKRVASNLVLGTTNVDRLTIDNTGAATFSNFVKVSGNNALGTSSTGGMEMAYFGAEAKSRIIIGDGSGYSFSLSKRTSSTNTDLFTITDSGAATFSAATQDAIQTVIRMSGNNASGQLKALDFKLTAGTPLWTISTAAVGTDAGINIMPNGSAGLSLAYNGAATFSSSVTATQGLFSENSGNVILQAVKTGATNATTAIIRQTGAGGNGNQDIGLIVDIQGANDDDRIANFRYYNGSTYTSRMVIKRGGNVGIGTSNPANGKLEIQTDASTGLWVQTGGTTSGYVIADFRTGTNASALQILGNGLLYSVPTYANASGSGANLGVFSNGELYRSTSSLKYKKNVENYTKGLAEVMQMRPVTYNSINEREDGILYAGLIAEEVHDLGLTEFVQYAEDGSPDALAYQNMVSLLVKAIQELKAEIEAQQQQINSLINR